MKSRLALFIAFFWVLLGLACNFPYPQQANQDLDGEVLRQTIQAASTLLETSQVGQVPVTPQPGTEIPATQTQTEEAFPENVSDPAGYYAYAAQSGDTLIAVAAHFGTEPQQIFSTGTIPSPGYITPGQVLYIPWEQDERLLNGPLLPDGEVVNSPATLGLDLADFIRQAGGYLGVYTETLDGEIITGVEIVQRVASQSSISPWLLLAFLEYRSNWVYGYPEDPGRLDYPIGFYAPGRKGLYQELLMTATQLNVGYYGWRQGSLLALKHPDQQVERLNPTLNAGSAALQHLFSKFYRKADWQAALYNPGSFQSLFRQMFGDPWAREARRGPLIPAGLTQPDLQLPFLPGERWSLTGGPHASWDSGTPRGALDFSPVTGEATCAVSSRWATAASPGIIARAADNAVVLDLDGDGYEQTGWVVVYYHLAESGLIPAGIPVAQDELLGHPSCEGGRSTGKHVHLARKYNGEWLPADGPLPFVLGGWRAVAEDRNYQGSLVKDGHVVTSSPGGNRSSIIMR